MKIPLDYLRAHKFKTVIGLVVVVAVGYYAYGRVTATVTPTQYTLAAVQKGTLITSIGGSGQVSALQQVDIKSKVSGDITAVKVAPGDKVVAGQVLFQIDSSDAARNVRDANLSLQTAELNLKKLKQPPSTLAILQAENALAQAQRDLADLKDPPDALELLTAENSLTSAQQALTQSQNNLTKAYDDAYTDVSNVYLSLPATFTGLEDLFFKSTITPSNQNIDWYYNAVANSVDREKAANYKNIFQNRYTTARTKYDQALAQYKTLSRSLSHEQLLDLLTQTYDAASFLSDAIKAAGDYINFVTDSITRSGGTVSSTIRTTTTSLNTYTETTNADVSDLVAAKSSASTAEDSLATSQRSVNEKTESLTKLKTGADKSQLLAAQEKVNERQASLDDLKDGPDQLDVRSQELTLQERRNALADAQSKLADYSVTAQFDGVMAKVSVKKGDLAASSTALATLITTQRIAEISLNEVDVSKVAVGQKATLTFDAVADLSISGQVAEVDAVGTVTQGVVNYVVKILFDTQDERIKPGMSVSSSIITDVKQDVLVVPNSAIKLGVSGSYVEAFTQQVSMASMQNYESPTLPIQKEVTTGSANDESTEVVSGLAEGDQIIIRTVVPTTQAAPTAPSLFGAGAPRSATGGGGNAFRALR